ncbi:hypothetical protein FACS1894217_06280 [Clostridia bacterium]|nr:hypothetical protein FACS1894217_06280 [Clostridia bacterium]
MKIGTVPPQLTPLKPEQKVKQNPTKQDDSPAVVAELSSRNAVAATNVESTGASLESVKAAITKNPDAAVAAQSHSSPERVLQLLA